MPRSEPKPEDAAGWRWWAQYLAVWLAIAAVVALWLFFTLT